jgi:4-hydroxy-tetrahydrodipicolinate synthase
VAALLVGNRRVLRRHEACPERADRLHDEEEDGRGGRDEDDYLGDEGAVAEDRVVDRERQIREVGLPDDHCDDRHQEIVDERVDERAERDAQHEGDREVDDVAPHQEVPELLDHHPSVLALVDDGESSPREPASTIARMLGEVLTAIVTPFRPNGSVDLDAFRALAGFLLDNGSDGIVVAGTTGEAPTLTDDERQELFEAAVDGVGGRGTVVAGTGTYSTAHSIHLTERAHEAGVDGFLVVTPYYNKPPQRGIVAHMEAVAAATDRPVVFYDIPSRVVVDAEPATIAALAEIENVRAVKQAKPSVEAARNVVACGLDLYAGDDDLILPFLEVGGVGGICVHTHVVGPQVKELIASYRAGDVERAHALDEELRPAIDILRVQTNPIAIKRALQLLGHEVGGLRLPLVEADEAETAEIRDCLERLGLLAGVAS